MSLSGTVTVSGPPDACHVVLVHGAGITKQMWCPQVEQLSAEFRVVTFDLPGHGTASDTNFEFDSAVERLSDVVEGIAGPNSILVGHSLGGYIALEYASHTPNQIAGLILSGSSADYSGWLGIRTRVVAALYRLGSRFAFLDRWFRDRTADQIRRLPITETTATAIIDGGFYLRSWGEAGSALAGRDFEKRLREYGGPVLLMNGENDTLNVPNAERLARVYENVEVDTVSNAGHLCNLQAPSAYTNRIREFVRNNERQ